MSTIIYVNALYNIYTGLREAHHEFLIKEMGVNVQNLAEDVQLSMILPNAENKWPPLRKTLNFISTTEQDLLFILSCVATMY